jgi:ribosomal protein S12 methylthiotransferase
MKLHLVSLGCAKNLVDSEVMLGRLMNAGWTHTRDPGKADIIIINTCSFIESAINESIDTILALAKYRHDGFCRRLIVAGCLPERFREEIVTAIPEVDFFLGTGAFDKIVEAVDGSLNAVRCFLPDPNLTGLVLLTWLI